MRAMDLVSPIGMGQRGYIVAPPGSGKTTILKHLCQAVSKGHPEIKLYCLLINERPEEVTDFKRSVTAEVRASSSDETYDHHVKMADDLMRQAISEAGAGQNVMIVVDSLTRLARVHNAQRRPGGRRCPAAWTLGLWRFLGRIFGAARKIENGGSLTILATILTETGSRMDDVIYEEFKGTGNMEIVLSREISGLRIFPAVDINKSGTRKEELLLEPGELEAVRKMRRGLADFTPVDAARELVDQLKSYPTNKEFLSSVSEA